MEFDLQVSEIYLQLLRRWNESKLLRVCTRNRVIRTIKAPCFILFYRLHLQLFRNNVWRRIFYTKSQ